MNSSKAMRLAGAMAVLPLLFLLTGTLSRDLADRGSSYLKPFKMQLKAALVEGMQSGPVNAVDVCNVRAPEIGDEVTGSDVTMGRTSHRLRNPDNAPLPWVEPLLANYLANPGETGSMLVEVGPDRIGYVEPIYIGSVCLVCHGTEIPDDVARRLADLYPEDRATGFREGDFRGLFWVEFPIGTR
jgi:hypothetical protein